MPSPGIPEPDPADRASRFAGDGVPFRTEPVHLRDHRCILTLPLGLLGLDRVVEIEPAPVAEVVTVRFGAGSVAARSRPALHLDDSMLTDDTPFGVSTARSGGRFDIVVRGVLDLATAPRLLAAADAARETGVGHVHLDLVGLDFIDSVALKVVIDLHRDLAAHGSRLTVRPGGPPVRRVFALCGLDAVLNLVTDEDQDQR